MTISNAQELIVIPLSHCHVIERLSIRPHSISYQGWVTASLRILSPRLTKLRRLEVGDLDLDSQHVDFFQAWSLLRDLDTKTILIDRIRFTKPSHLERLVSHLPGKHVDIVNPNPSPGIGVFYMPTHAPLGPTPHDSSGIVNLHVPWRTLASKLDACRIRVPYVRIFTAWPGLEDSTDCYSIFRSVIQMFQMDHLFSPHSVELRCHSFKIVLSRQGECILRSSSFDEMTVSMLTASSLGSPPGSTIHITSTSPEFWTHIAKQFLCAVSTYASSSSSETSPPPPFNTLHLQHRTRANAFPEIVRLSTLTGSKPSTEPSSSSYAISATLTRPVMPLYSFCFNKPRAVQLWTAFDDALVSSSVHRAVRSVEFDVEDTPAVLPTYFDTWTEKMEMVVDMTEDLSVLLPRLVRSGMLESKVIRISSTSR